MAENRYITVAYKLFAPMQDNDRELIEEATEERPFQFISALGMTLDAFEAQISPLAPGAEFDIKLGTEEAYGPFVPEAVQKVSADIFKINGKIDSRYIYEGAVVPLQNADGERFNGTITEITEKEITVDLNHPLAGKELNGGEVLGEVFKLDDQGVTLAERIALGVVDPHLGEVGGDDVAGLLGERQALGVGERLLGGRHLAALAHLRLG